MKIEFKKITNIPKKIEIHYDTKSLEILSENENIYLCGELKRVDSELTEFRGRLCGELELICAKSGEEFVKKINEDLVLYFSDGIWETQSQMSKDNFELDIIEFFEGFIDFDFILESEIESIRLDYNIKE